MAKKPGTNGRAPEYVLFNVTYEDDSQRSNRRVTTDEAAGGDGAVKAALEQQDRAIAEKSGKPPLAIKGIVRVG
jgi:hypothetical protein